VSLGARVVLAIFSAIFAAIMFASASQSEHPVDIYAFGGFCSAIALACFARGRSARALGSLSGATVFGIGVWYIAHEALAGPFVSGTHSKPSLLNAGLFMLVFGIPSLAYAWRARFGFGPDSSTLQPEALFVVSTNDEGISVMSPDGETRKVAWSSLSKVGIRTTSDGPLNPDVFWGFHEDAETPVVAFPGGATGEQELISVLGDRLKGFRTDEFIRAMGSTDNAYFLLWERTDAVA
jgi:hypothetical protein